MADTLDQNNQNILVDVAILKEQIHNLTVGFKDFGEKIDRLTDAMMGINGEHGFVQRLKESEEQIEANKKAFEKQLETIQTKNKERFEKLEANSITKLTFKVVVGSILILLAIHTLSGDIKIIGSIISAIISIFPKI